MKESRSNTRRLMDNQQTHKVEFSVENGALVQRPLEPRMTGTLIDIRRNGIGFLTDVPLKPGNVLKFNNFDACDSGIVMWTLKSEQNYRVGVRFVEE
jgi:hypothetical protein